MKIIPLKEGNYSVTKNKEFTELNEFLPATDLKMAINPFLVIVGEERILLDTGLGTIDTDGMPLIYRNLEKERVKPTAITKILLSHLHKDHIEGLGQMKNGKLISNFPEAEIFLQKRELAFALEQKDVPSYNPRLLEKLAELPNLIFMEDDEGMISNEISYQVTGGHSPFHQVFWIREQKQTAFYGADNLPQRGYLKLHIAYKSDYDGKKAMMLRQEWERKANKEHWAVLLYHDMKLPILRF
ncbi:MULTISPECIES: MBL fold metallo-hydrolase [Olivibacter]|jgi:glyoxylase-like metal-dependent hydrolase (beta-lactamase superfamily II)|uniref:MBL fold metallo-hydrolase n=1 Tax=Olivibacter oleidegradans TaxID=760123 RepID=A0ABV6HPF4_9SPHI|nr:MULTISPECIES: MBL fold metallo-hydrolase [Olivibacter]MDM8173546.1 MBL fold metallo-hydrolase [Olivibacter sp. 47]QEL03264.1 MBL fold metallo-hydrolase [Olivibacter sp. LS-1]